MSSMLQGVNLTHDGADMVDSLDDVAGANLTLGAYHGGTPAYSAEGLAEIEVAANEGNT